MITTRVGVGPVTLAAVGDQYTDPCRIALFLWVGSSTAGDTVQVSDPVTGELIWTCRTDITNTYIGASMPAPGVHCPRGFKLVQRSSGTVYVYIQESAR